MTTKPGGPGPAGDAGLPGRRGGAVRDRLGSWIDAALVLGLRPDWALRLPEPRRGVHLGDSHRARRFQRDFGRLRGAGLWAASHVCLMHCLTRFEGFAPRRYLEIGVSDGLSVLAVVTALQARQALSGADTVSPLFDELVLADTWRSHFGGAGRGSHAHVARRLAAVGAPLGPLRFLDGDSKRTVPAYLASRDPLPFEAIYLDGDHSYEGAQTDLRNVLPHVGDMLFFDDMYHPVHCFADRLLRVHRQLVRRLQDDYYAFLNRAGYGFAAFIRKPLVDAGGE